MAKDQLSDAFIFKVLDTVLNEDVYIHEFMDEGYMADVYELFEYEQLIWVASDNRVFLTNSGMELLEDLNAQVDLHYKPSKIKRKL